MTDREIDGAFLAEVAGEPMLVHLEYQNYLDTTIPRRMHEYASILELQYWQQSQTAIPVMPLVIWAVDGKTPPPIYHQERLGKILCHREYFELHLSQMNWHQVDPLLLVLAPYLQGVQREDLETIALRLYEAAPPTQQRMLLGAFFALSERKFADFGEIEQAILQKVRQQMDEILQTIEESSIGTAILEKGKTEGFVSAVQILWQNRFGIMPAEVMVAIRGLAETQLHDLLTLVVSAPSEAEVRTSLGL